MQVPVIPLGDHGIPRGKVRTPLASVSYTEYAAGLRIARHTHELPNLCVVLEGGFRESWGTRSAELGEEQVVAKPGGAEHVNEFSPNGARVLNIDLSGALRERLDGVGEVIREPRVLRDPRAAQLCREIELEMVHPDELTPLVVEANVLCLVVCFCQAERRRSARARAPKWLGQARELIQAHATQPLRLDSIAGEIGVSAGHLAKQFRQHYRCSIAEYLRRRRVQLAIGALKRPHESLAALAIEVGFCDQSHLCRVFKQVTGMTVTEFRTRMA